MAYKFDRPYVPPHPLVYAQYNQPYRRPDPPPHDPIHDKSKNCTDCERWRAGRRAKREAATTWMNDPHALVKAMGYRCTCGRRYDHAIHTDDWDKPHKFTRAIKRANGDLYCLCRRISTDSIHSVTVAL